PRYWVLNHRDSPAQTFPRQYLQRPHLNKTLRMLSLSPLGVFRISQTVVHSLASVSMRDPKTLPLLAMRTQTAQRRIRPPRVLPSRTQRLPPFAADEQIVTPRRLW